MSEKPKTTLYHNPRCTKSRQTLALLQEQGIEPEIIEYLNTPPDKKQLNEILDKLGLEPRELMRTFEAEYKDANLADDSLSRDDLINAMLEHPMLIQRPIVLANGKVALGRPPEQVLELFK